jgi:NAD(P)-dependent dehydrogenase (short-subunit alcohol dehydrogenase family)
MKRDASAFDACMGGISVADSMLRDAASIVLIVPGFENNAEQAKASMSSEATALGLTRQLARRFVKRRIRVNGMLVPSHDQSSSNGAQSATRHPLLQAIAGTLTYLLSNESRWITGQVIPISGPRY